MSSVSKRYSYMSVHSDISDQSGRIPTVPIPYVDEDLYMIIPSAPSASNVGRKFSHQLLPSTVSPPTEEKYIYYAVQDYRPDKEGYIPLVAGEAVEVLDKSDRLEWFITTVGTEERPSEEGLVPVNILSAEYIPVRYDSLQGEDSGSDNESEQVPPPLPPHHPNRQYHGDDIVQPTTGGHAASKEDASTIGNSPQTENTSESPTDDEKEVTGDMPKQPDQVPSIVTSVPSEDRQEEDEDTSSEQSDTTPMVSPRGSVHTGSNRSSPIIEKGDPSSGNLDDNGIRLTQSLTAVEMSKKRNRLHRCGSDPSIQDPVPLSDSSPAYSIPNLATAAQGSSPMHERVSSLLRESLMSTSRSRRRSSCEYAGHSNPLDRKRMHASSPIVSELRDILSHSSPSRVMKSSSIENKMADHHSDMSRSSSISPEDALSEMKKLQLEAVVEVSCMYNVCYLCR